MCDLFSLKGKVGIVTGSNRGIGKGIVRGLASVGCGIAIAARNQKRTEQAAREIREEFKVEVLPIHADLRQEDQIQSMVEKVLDHFGRIDILVNNSGINIRKLPQETSAAEWDEVINLNLRSTFLCCKAVYPAMKKSGGGKIINIASINSILGGAGKLAPYSASKGGVMQLTRSLAAAWAPDNIQVNSILPGWIDTELTVQARKDMPGLNERVLSRTLTGRWGKPEDLAGPAVFLAGPSSEFVTGAALVVDGGYSIVI